MLDNGLAGSRQCATSLGVRIRRALERRPEFAWERQLLQLPGPESSRAELKVLIKPAWVGWVVSDFVVAEPVVE